MPGEWQEVVIPASESYYHGNPRAVTSLASTSMSTVHWKSYNIRKLEPGVMYEAEVAARNKYGWAQKSDIFQFNTRSAGGFSFHEMFILSIHETTFPSSFFCVCLPFIATNIYTHNVYLGLYFL